MRTGPSGWGDVLFFLSEKPGIDREVDFDFGCSVSERLGPPLPSPFALFRFYEKCKSDLFGRIEHYLQLVVTLFPFSLHHPSGLLLYISFCNSLIKYKYRSLRRPFVNRPLSPSIPTFLFAFAISHPFHLSTLYPSTPLEPRCISDLTGLKVPLIIYPDKPFWLP